VSVEKAQIKMSTAHEIGARLDDVLEATERDALRIEGGVEWIARAVVLAATAQKRVEVDVDSGKMDLETAKLVKDAIGRLGADLSKLGAQAGAELHGTRGKAAGLNAAVAVAKQAFEVEKAKAEAITRAEAAEAADELAKAAGALPDPAAEPRRVTGRRPGPSMKAKRGKRDG